jgi:small subunit ribosomal protein S17
VKKLIGKIITDKMEKTKVVEITTVLHHPIYNKSFKKTKKISVDDPNDISKVGDVVEIISVRPVSKNKSFRISKVEGNTK